MVQCLARTVMVTTALAASFAALSHAAQQPPAQQAAAQTPRTPQALAPIDLTGYWASIVTEDWRWRMVTPRKGDYASVPLNPEGRKMADTWDLAQDAADGNQCRAFGVGGIMRIPGRLHITWQDPNTLTIETDAGTQTRLLHFDRSLKPGAEKTWQGWSVAEWADLVGGGGGGRGAAPQAAPRGGSLKVVTTTMRPGYLRKNGVPYSDAMVLTEYFDRHDERDGSQWLTVTSIVDDPKYLNQPFVTSTSFKKEPDAAKWHPTPCSIDPPRT